MSKAEKLKNFPKKTNFYLFILNRQNLVKI
jgi:hypothetical protein